MAEQNLLVENMLTSINFSCKIRGPSFLSSTAIKYVQVQSSGKKKKKIGNLIKIITMKIFMEKAQGSYVAETD